MEEVSIDLLVIGSGPAGQKAAIQAAKLAKSVIVVERDIDPGGNCLYTGTIPSKTLREAIIDLTRFYERSFSGQSALNTVSITQLNNRLLATIEEERALVYRQFKKNNVQLIIGAAEFRDASTVDVRDRSGTFTWRIHAQHIILATGSTPRHPRDIPFDGQVILDSTTLLQLEVVPKSMIVLGGGVIGAEYASFFAALGTEVTIIDRKDHILPMLDAEIGIHLQTALTDLGLKFLGGKEPEKISKRDGKAHVRCSDGTELEAEVLLFALGRAANVEGLQIENAGITLTQKGYVEVNELFQTYSRHIYAVGDLIGGASLASTSMEQGRLATRHALGVPAHQFPSFFPVGIYTIPEISCYGMTEEELIKMGFRYEIGRAYYYEIARSHIVGSKIGMFKLLFHAETLEMLGIHIVGRNATEVIHIGQVAISFNAKIDYFIDQVFNYPTYAEGYRVAALNGLNKIKFRK
jgi:NAD(P) transhydrogenase